MAGEGLSADGAVVGQEAFVCGLDGGDCAAFAGGDFDEAGSAGAGFAADVEMVADEVEEGVSAREIAGGPDGAGVAGSGGLGDEVEFDRGTLRGGGAGGFVAGMDNDGDLLHAGLGGFLDEDGEDGAVLAVAVDKVLERKGPLGGAGGGDYGFIDCHSWVSPDFSV